MYTAVNWFWGIDLEYTVRLGRRVRIWHHGGMVIGARAIGDDVHLRHNTTLGVLSRTNLSGKPIIGHRVDIGVGACILGPVTVGDDAVIGANSVVIRDVRPGAVMMGVPARQASLTLDGLALPTPSRACSNRMDLSMCEPGIASSGAGAAGVDRRRDRVRFRPGAGGQRRRECIDDTGTGGGPRRRTARPDPLWPSFGRRRHSCGNCANRRAGRERPPPGRPAGASWRRSTDRYSPRDAWDETGTRGARSISSRRQSGARLTASPTWPS